jgi:hypothetical protein
LLKGRLSKLQLYTAINPKGTIRKRKNKELQLFSQQMKSIKMIGGGRRWITNGMNER